MGSLASGLALPELGYPLRRGLESAERVEVQLHLAVAYRVIRVGQRPDEPVRTRGAHEVGYGESVFPGDPRAGPDAEARCVAQQPSHACRARYADPDRQHDAAFPYRLDPLQNRVDVEAKLRDHAARQPQAGQ